MTDEITAISKTFVEKRKYSKTKWMNEQWRPAMAWLYLAICAFDFILFPLASMVIPVVTHSAYVAWQPITLSNGGLIHVAFGAILGISSWGRTKEKLNGLADAPVAH